MSVPRNRSATPHARAGNPVTSVTASRESAELAGIIDELCEYFADVHANWNDSEEPLFISLWVLHTWFINRGYAFRFDYTTYLNAVSYGPDCGKTELAAGIQRVTEDSFRSTPTVTAIRRFLNTKRRVLLIDQFHNLGTARLSDREQLNSILCNGFMPGTQDALSNPDGDLDFYDTYFPKAFFGLVPNKPVSEEISSRSVRIVLNPATNEQYAVLESRTAERNPIETGYRINARIKAWRTDRRFTELDQRMNSLGKRVAITGERNLLGREADLWRMMFALADMAGTEYGKRIREFAAKQTVSQHIVTQTDQIEAGILDGKLIRLAEQGILPVDNWNHPGKDPIPDRKAVNTASSFGWPRDRRYGRKEQTPVVSLLVSMDKQTAELRIPIGAVKEIAERIGISRADIIRVYRNAKRLHAQSGKDTISLPIFSGQKPTAILAIDFTPVIFGTENN